MLLPTQESAHYNSYTSALSNTYTSEHSEGSRNPNSKTSKIVIYIYIYLSIYIYILPIVCTESTTQYTEREKN